MDIYHYVQHPVYTGAMCLLTCPMFLYYRMDGVMGCWVPPRYYGFGREIEKFVVPAIVAFWWAVVFKRVAQEEEMLRDKFGGEWEWWHRGTARFVPWVV